MSKFKRLDTVRLLDYPEGSINSHGHVNHVYPDGRVWVSNINMPYIGTVNKIFRVDELDRLELVPRKPKAIVLHGEAGDITPDDIDVILDSVPLHGGGRASGKVALMKAIERLRNLQERLRGE